MALAVVRERLCWLPLSRIEWFCVIECLDEKFGCAPRVCLKVRANREKSGQTLFPNGAWNEAGGSARRRKAAEIQWSSTLVGILRGKLPERVTARVGESNCALRSGRSGERVVFSGVGYPG